MAKYQEAALATQQELPDLSNALALAETREVIDQIIEDLCGLVKMKEGPLVKLNRLTKPKVTYEFAKEVATKIYIEVNRITGRTDFSVGELDAFYLKQCETLSEYFAIVGINHLISDSVWEKALELAKPDPAFKGVEDSKGNVLRPNFWQSKYNINWSYHLPFNVDMLNIIKREYDLGNESFGQDVMLRSIFWSIRIFIHGGLARSKNHLTLEHEKVVHKESYVAGGNTPDGVNQPQEGKLEQVKAWLRGALGGN